MKLEGSLRARIQAYLDAVAEQTSGRGDAAQRELLHDLERHILESLEREGGGEPTAERLEAVLATMDPPESFGEPADDPAPAAETTGGGSGPGGRRAWYADRWFVAALLFLAVNAWAVWRWTGHAAADAAPAVVFSADDGAALTNRMPLAWVFTSPMRPPPRGVPPVTFRPEATGIFEWRSPRELVFTPSGPWMPGHAAEAELAATLVSEAGRELSDRVRRFRFHTEPLALLAVNRKTIDPNRSLVLELAFNAPVVPSVVAAHTKISATDGSSRWDIACRPVGETHGPTVLLRTDPVMRDSAVLTVRRGLPPAAGELSLPADWTQEVSAVVDRLTFHSMQPSSPSFGECSVKALFDDAIDPASAAGRVAVDPAVKFTAQQADGWSSKGMVLNGAFLPGHTYRITLRAGLTGVAGARLPQDVTRTVLFPDRSRSIAIAADGQYLSPGGALTIPVTLMNVRRCELQARPIPPQNLVYYAMREASKYSNEWGSDDADHAQGLTAPAARKTYEVPDTRNVDHVLHVRLAELVGGPPAGAYLVSAESAGLRQADRVVFVTDLGISARIAGEQALVWVNSLRTAKAAAGAEVALYGQNNIVLAHGTTDADGVAILTFKRPAAESTPFAVTATVGRDLSCLILNETRVSATDLAEGRPFLADRNEACVFTDRGVYRPGEPVHAKALVRNRALEAPKPFPVLFRVVKPDGRLFREIPAMLDARGAAECEVRIPDYLPTGRHHIELALPGAGATLGLAEFAVEDFVPPQIEVKVEPESGRVAADDVVSFTVRARHLFGRPAAGLSLNAGVTFKPVPFASPKWPGYTFGDETREFARVYKPLGQAALDDEGAAGFNAEADAGWRPPAAMQAVMGATVMEPNGRTVTASSAVPFDPYPYYVGLKPAREGGRIRVGEQARVAVAVVMPDGSPAKPAHPLKVSLASQTWVNALRKDPDGSYRYHSDRVTAEVRKDTVKLVNGVAEYAFAAPAAGEYVLTVTDPVSDAAGSVRFFAAAPDEEWVDWSKEDPELVDLEPDRELYAPGDTARIAIKAPFTGTALLTVETDRVLERRRIELGRNTLEVEVPIGPDYTPNVFCSLTLLRPAVAESVWSAHRAAGWVSLPVAPKGRKLDVKVEAPDVARPQAKLTAKLHVRDEAGQGAAGEVVVAAVDEGILMLTEFATPDPLAWFLEERALGVETYDLYGLLMPETADEAGAADSKSGGDEETSLRRRLNPIRASRFKPVALWASHIETGTNGEAEVSFDVPEFTGRLRLMAVAFDRSRIGSGEGRVAIKRPLVVQPALPRFLTAGDRCRMGVQVFNETGTTRPVEVRVTCGGPLKAPAPEQRFTLKAGASKNAWFDLEAGAAPGKALCTIEARAGDERYSEAIELAVRPAAARVSASSFGAVEPGAEVRLAPSAGWLPETAEIELWAAGRPGVGNLGALQWLMHYPYGCVEQTTSQLLPLLHLADLANEALPDSMRGGDAAQFVRAGILRLLSMQDAEGAFRVWPDSTSVDEWCSMYATFALVEARAAGYEVPAGPLDAALDRVRAALASDPPVLDEDPANPLASGRAWRDDMERRAFACHVLARAARPEPGWIARLQEQKARLSYGARAHLAAALIYSGRPREGSALLTELGVPAAAEVRRSDAIFNSRERLTALALSAWVDVDPQNAAVPALAAALDSLRPGGTWSTTYDNGWALFALGKYARGTRGTPSEFRAQCLPDGAAALDFASGRTFRWSSREPGATTAVRLANRGPGRCFYGVRIAGVPADGRVAEGDWGLAVRREWMTVDGEPWPQDRKPKQGELLVVKLSMGTDRAGLDNVVVEDLLPAGLEIENPALGTSQVLPWVQEKSEWCIHREIRDDRLVLFSGGAGGKSVYYYAVRAVTPGRYVMPAVTAEAMYDPSLHSAHGRAVVEVVE